MNGLDLKVNLEKLMHYENSMLNAEATKGLVEPENCVSGHEAGVYETRSHYTIGKHLVD